MMRRLILVFLFLAITLIEVTVTTLPLLLIFLLVIFISYKENNLFLFAVIFGLLFDFLSIRLLGQTSLFLLIYLLVITLYEKKFESSTLPFVFLAALIGSFFYLWFLGYPTEFLASGASAFLAVIIFLGLGRLPKTKNESRLKLPDW